PPARVLAAAAQLRPVFAQRAAQSSVEAGSWGDRQGPMFGGRRPLRWLLTARPVDAMHDRVAGAVDTTGPAAPGGAPDRADDPEHSRQGPGWETAHTNPGVHDCWS